MKKAVITIIIVVGVIIFGIGSCSYWYLNHTASGVRTVKDFKSETSNGIEREITVYNADGKAIMHFKGKFDISHSSRSLQYVDQQNRKHNIYFGDNTTVIVNELK
ncbi:hypothetical protein LB941_00950 [Ligilactobacillus sp. WILCCON 0076]|uniref:Uncharacterized protein n=1 Tax=Ligilactobacillus ubinensis TaxID=2876789 RepID=A0A9X2JLC1_9LACO|nr:hypothetical protein [Ligilactobacillus ubinensis]MCP0885901.1 hypothetical protein [Ligilactobacillus ubinensis]